MSEDTTLSLAVVLGYLLGSIPFGLILPKLTGFGDVRRIGSGNIGATNVLRTGSKGLALAVLLLDAGKGAVTVWAVASVSGDPTMYLSAGISAVFGHIFPVWLRRDRKALLVLALVALGLSTMLTQQSSVTAQLLGSVLLIALTAVAWGGKGVATALGVLLAAAPLVGALTALTWLAAAMLLRRSSIGALTAMAVAPVLAAWLTDSEHAAFALFLSVVVALRHSDNVRRLVRGEEPRIDLSGSGGPN